MIGKKFIEGHNLGQKVNHAIHIGAKVATVGATIYGLHQAHKNNDLVGGIKHVLGHNMNLHDDSSHWGLKPLQYEKLGNYIKK